MRFIRYLAPAALLLAFGLASLASAATPSFSARQGATPPSCIVDVTVERLGAGLPSAANGLQLTLLRVTFAPGGSIGAHIHPGALTLSIESGALVYSIIEGETAVQRAAAELSDATEIPTEPLAAGQETILNPGDWLYEEGIIHSARNDGDEPTVVLIAGLMQAGQPFTQCHDQHATPSS